MKQAESGVDQLDDQVKSTNEQLSDSAKQQAQSDGYSNEGDRLSDRGDALQDEQKKLQDDQKDLADDQKDLADLKARPIEVGDVAKVQTENAPATVRREDGKQAVTITGTPGGTDLGAVNTALRPRSRSSPRRPASRWSRAARRPTRPRRSPSSAWPWAWRSCWSSSSWWRRSRASCSR